MKRERAGTRPLILKIAERMLADDTIMVRKAWDGC